MPQTVAFKAERKAQKNLLKRQGFSARVIKRIVHAERLEQRGTGKVR